MTISRRSLMITIALATGLWWVAGFLIPQTPQWWGLGFSVGLILCMWLMWAELRADGEKELKDEMTRRSNERDGDLNRPTRPGYAPRPYTALDQTQEPLVQSPRAVAPLATSGQDVVAHLRAGAIRVFASMDDAIKHGWSFFDQIGMLGDQPLYRSAKKVAAEDKESAQNVSEVWVFDGLVGQDPAGIVPETIRVFGKMRYRLASPTNPL